MKIHINYVENLSLEVESEPVIQVEEESSVTPEMVKEAISTISESSIKEEPGDCHIKASINIGIAITLAMVSFVARFILELLP